MSKTKVKVCRICLRSDVLTRDVDPSLNDFYDELCEYDTYENLSLRYCSLCEHQLRKCFHFKQRCQKGNAVLKAWRKKKLSTFPKTLYRLLPPSPLDFCSVTARHREAEYKYEDHGPVVYKTDDRLSKNGSDSEHYPQEDIPLSNLSVTQITPQNITKLNQEMNQPSSVSSVPSTTIDTHSECGSTTEKVSIEVVKEEPVWEIEEEKSVKDELSEIEEEKSVKDELSEIEEERSVKDELSEIEEEKSVKDELSVNEEGVSVNEDEIPVIKDTIPVKDDKISVKVERLGHTKPFACDICDKRFSWKEYLVRHMRCHREKPFSCVKCDKHFIDSYRFVAHMRIHSEENPYACTICDKNFTQNFSLERHIRIHTGEKPFSCTTCRERFNQKSSLISHERTHSGEKPYYCKSCDKHFCNKWNLVRHMRVHSVEKLYVCNKCDKKYKRKSFMEKHKRKCS